MPKPALTPGESKLRTLYQEDLCSGRCASPACHVDHTGERMYLHPACHPHSAVQVSFTAGDPDSLMVLCASCEQPVCKIALGSRPQPAAKVSVPADGGFAA